MTRPSYELRGKVVLITGGTGGNRQSHRTRTHRPWREGRHRRRRARGRHRSPRRKSSQSAFGSSPTCMTREALDVAVAEVVDRFGRVDVAIANAGILSRAATLRTTPTASIEALLAVNVTGVVNTVPAAMDQVVAHRGQFVLISSVFAFLNGMGTIPYAMSKAAVEQLGRGLRVELAAHGVSTTVAYFSLIETNMIKQGVDGDPIVDELLAACRGRCSSACNPKLPQQHSPTASPIVRRASWSRPDGNRYRRCGDSSRPRWIRA